MMAVPYRVCSTLLTHDEVREILEHPPDGISKLPPAKPKGGEVYLMEAADDSQKGENISYIFEDNLAMQGT